MQKKRPIPLFLTSLIGGIFFAIALSAGITPTLLGIATNITGVLVNQVGNADLQNFYSTASALFFVLGLITVAIDFAIIIASGWDAILPAFFGYVAGFFLIEYPLIGIVLSLVGAIVTATLYWKHG